MRYHHLYKSPTVDIKLCPRSPQISITLNEIALLVFCDFGVEKLLAWLWIEPAMLDLSYQSGAYDLAAMLEMDTLCNL